MRALVATDLTGINSLAVRHDWPEAPMRAGQVRVALEAAALNYPDLLMLTGSYQHKPAPPFVPGMEGAGVVTDVAADIDRGMISQRVMVAARGTFAETVVSDADEVTPVPSAWTMEEAAAFPVVGKTAFHALMHRARLQAGEHLVVHGASGGTGHMAVKIGKALGARVVATTGDPDKHAMLLACGADAIVDARATDLADRLKAACGGRGCDVVFDPVGGTVFDASLKAAAFGARILVIGFVAKAPNTVRTNYALIKGLSILGVRAGEAARQDPAIAASYRTDLPALTARADLRPHIGATFTLADAAEAFRCLEARAFSGKIVVRI